MASDIETAGDYHWRNSMKPVKFFALDARAAASLFLVLLHMRLWTLYICIIVMVGFNIVESRGYTVPSALRALRSWIVGSKRPAWMYIRKRKLVDYG